MSDLLPYDARCPICNSDEADFITMITDPDIDYLNFKIYKCKCDHYLLVKSAPEPFIDWFKSLETAIASARLHLLQEVIDFSRDTFTDLTLSKAETLFRKLKYFFAKANRHRFLLRDKFVEVELLPLKDSIRVEIHRIEAFCIRPCIRDFASLDTPKEYSFGKYWVWEVFTKFSSSLQRLRILWLDVDENDSTCIRDILRFAFG